MYLRHFNININIPRPHDITFVFIRPVTLLHIQFHNELIDMLIMAACNMFRLPRRYFATHVTCLEIKETSLIEIDHHKA